MIRKLSLFSVTCLLSTTLFADSLSLLKLKRIDGSTGWNKISENKNIMGGPIRINDTTYKTGICAHSASALLYAIPKGAKRFSVTAGIDDFISKTDAGSVILRIEAGPDSSYLRELARSGKLTAAGNRIHNFDVNLPADAKVIQLIVEDGGDGNKQDHVDWVNPTFQGPGKLIPRKVNTPPPPGSKPEGPLPYWNDVSILQINRLAPRAHYIAYPTKELAAKGGWNRTATPFRKSLNGSWKFRYSPTPNQRPADFYKTGFDVSDWNKITVPKSWQSAGYGIPIYNNNTFPFNRNPPYIDQTFNPVGSYKRTFTVPQSWDGRRILIHFAGVDSAFTLWINGKEVGYSEGSRTPAEFDITKYLKKGNNDLAVEVIRFSSGAWLEDQDFWRLSGIFRDVELISQPAGERLVDFRLNTPLDASYIDATFELTCKFENTANGKVDIQVTDQTGHPIINETESVSRNAVRFSIPVKAPHLWSAESPYLYNLTITHLDKQGRTIEVIPWEFGFRWSEIKNKRLLLNGKPIVIAGVNRHEHSPENGHYCSVEAIRSDIIQMKKLNLNAIRTCHYPNAPELYALANEYGLYVNDEANIESHGNESMPNRPDMAASHHLRMQRMIERDKNFTSVICWSLGNESGSGGAHNDNYKWAKAHDPRPVAYQRHGQNDYTDFNSAFYVGPGGLAGYNRNKNNKTMIQSEYAHAMGNSSGNLREYWDIYWADNNTQGGFIWDWLDQGLKLPVPERSWIRLSGVNADNLIVEGNQLTKNGLRGILYFCHGSEPEFKPPWTLKMTLRTAPKSSDGLAFFPLFSKDSSTGAIFLERNSLVFQTFGFERNKLIATLPDTFFDGGIHSLTVSMDGSYVQFFCDGKRIFGQRLYNKIHAKWSGYVAFGPAVGTPLIPERIESNAPTMLRAKLAKGRLTPQAIRNASPIIDLDFTKQVTVLNHRRAGGSFYAYGGYWENRRGHMNPGNFCMNGIIAANGNPHPGAYAFQYTQQPFETKLVDQHTISIHNRNFFKALGNDISARWCVTANGKTIEAGTLNNLQIKPQMTEKVHVPYKTSTNSNGIEYRLQITYELAEKTSWAKKGHRIAWDEFLLAYTPAKPAFNDKPLKVFSAGPALMLKGDDFSVTFDKHMGELIEYSFKGHKLITSPLHPDFWRGTTDNDRSYGQNHLAAWMAIDSISAPVLQHRKISEGLHEISVTGDLGKTGAKIAMNFRVHGDGQIEIKTDFIPNPKQKKDSIIPRFGLRTALADNFSKISWYGRGPRETYCDRNFELIGSYRSTVDTLFTDYSRPQEYGNISEVRQAWIGPRTGTGLKIITAANAPVNISARRYKSQTLEHFKYSYELPPSTNIYLNIDGRVNGVAGINTWGAKPLNQYRLVANAPMSYKFIIRAE